MNAQGLSRTKADPRFHDGEKPELTVLEEGLVRTGVEQRRKIEVLESRIERAREALRGGRLPAWEQKRTAIRILEGRDE